MEAKTLQSASFDVVPFWVELEKMLKFVRDRLTFGQTDVEGSRMDNHLLTGYTTLRNTVVKDQAQSRQASRVLFWEDCKKALSEVFDCKEKKPKGSVSFEQFYEVLHQLQTIAFNRSADFWKSSAKPPSPPFAKVFAGDWSRSRSPKQKSSDGGRWWCSTRGCARKRPLPSRLERCDWCGKDRPKQKFDPKMGPNGIWQWRNPPRPLHEGSGFWIFNKSAYWVCDTPPDPAEFEKFRPEVKHVDGHFTSWIHEKYAKQHPFLNRYEPLCGIEYGLLNRLDRETSGPVIVCKDEDAFNKIKRTRDRHEWHKEYVCLVHGQIPVDQWEGVVECWLQPKGDGFKTTVVHDNEGLSKLVKWATSMYQVLGYFRDARGKGYSYVKVRIVTGLTHQIRVHMQHLLQSFGDKLPEPSWQRGLVSDFLYLDWETHKFDKANICERVFLHERRLGMWDPDDQDRIMHVSAELPDELQEAMARLRLDQAAMGRLTEHKRASAEACPVERFAQRFCIGALEKRELLSGEFWRTKPNLRSALMEELERREGQELKDGLSVNGDFGFVLSGIRQALESCLRRCRDSWSEVEDARQPGGPLYEVLRRHVDDCLWHQGRKKEAVERESALASEPLPPGWRRMEREGEVFYLHERGRRERRRPVIDDGLPEGWIKLATSRADAFLYHHLVTGQTKASLPSAGEHLVPQGWSKRASSSAAVYYVHRATGRVQFGLPCPGPPEELPGAWEKVASSKPGGQAYYFDRATGASQFERPEEGQEGLPPGWRAVRSSKGEPYFFHAASGKCQFKKPEPGPQ